ncbi:nuclear transport factor 2 family protein [Acidobacterium sp. S8]|uniref:nuclear transport factor 2 family protein n=1 Tax=Acidobacterium sp. S8 TaxID=1641854 RepID=UPI00131CE89C|nr:nuclear transport factor 2 family protein [Acidobacterium sp. S8]
MAEDVTQTLRAKDQALLDAIAPGNVKVWDEALASGAVYVDENGVIIDRAAFLKQLTPLPAGASGTLVISSYQATLHGAVATVIHTDDETENYHGQTLKAQYLSTETWQKTQNDWKLLQVHTYAVLKDPPTQKLSENELDTYVGRYSAGDLVYTLHLEGDRLIGQRGGGPPVEWNAELRDVFFITGDPRIRRIFQRDASGKITGFVDRRESWDLVWKKTG